MKIVKIMGGLGNQMFQGAFALALAEHDEETFIDINFFKKKHFKKTSVDDRELELFVFDTCLRPANCKQIKKCFNEKRLSHNFSNKVRKILKLKQLPSNSIKEYEDGLLHSKENLYFEGYWSICRIIEPIRHKIINDFKLKKPLDEKNSEILKKIKETNSVSIHIRRGDYVKLQHIYKLCDENYYNDAVSYIKEKIENPEFFIFSEDLDWIKENIKIDFPINIVDNNIGKGYFDMELMRNCKHNITANSTFSWWGAWLNENPEKIVITPKQWFSDPNFSEKDTIPDSWIRL